MRPWRFALLVVVFGCGGPQSHVDPNRTLTCHDAAERGVDVAMADPEGRKVIEKDRSGMRANLESECQRDQLDQRSLHCLALAKDLAAYKECRAHNTAEPTAAPPTPTAAPESSN